MDTANQGLLAHAEPISGNVRIDIPSTGANLQGRIQGQGQQAGAIPGETPASIFQQSSHPTVLFFHLLFRTLALLLYVIWGTFSSSSFVFIFVLTVLCLSLDFWTVKNVSGRLLVGLRWWNETREDGTSVWVFESKPQNRAVNPVDSRVFWLTLYVYPLIWVALLLVAVLKLSVGWSLLCVVALSLHLTNVLGYRSCDKDANARLAGYFTGGSSDASRGMLGNIVGGMISSRVQGFLGTTAPAGGATMRV